MKSYKLLLVLLGITLLMACSSIPITSWYKLYKLDPFAIDPQQFRLIIRAHEAIVIRKGGVKMEFGFKTEDNSLIIDDLYIIEIERNGSLPSDVLDDRASEEALTLMKLSESDIVQFTETQKLLLPYFEAGDDTGDSSFHLRINDICLSRPLPPGKSLLTVYLQSEVEDGFFVFLKNVDMRKKRKDIDGGLEDIPLCTDSNE